jgi:hypothetical protein
VDANAKFASEEEAASSKQLNGPRQGLGRKGRKKTQLPNEHEPEARDLRLEQCECSLSTARYSVILGALRGKQSPSYERRKNIFTQTEYRLR